MTTRRSAILLAAVAAAGLGVWAFAPPLRSAPEADVRAEVMAADRAFYKAAAEKGLDGWMGFMADDAVRLAPIGTKAHVGTDAVRKLDAELFADPKARLEWEPTDGGAFADRKYGWTTGRAKIVARTDAGGEEVRWTGAYVTWWRKDPAGWRVILDTGAADPPKK
ncbi:MAG: nuclear transport factor 2 family protein [Gemmataceae bacterium]|nr:nuclear transport factor 2 family protein [Gemmataceae bacterium]